MHSHNVQAPPIDALRRQMFNRHTLRDWSDRAIVPADPLHRRDGGRQAGDATASLACGADIAAITAIRMDLCVMQGRRSAAAPVRMATLAIHGLAGADPAAIASDPTVPDRTSAVARALIAGHPLAPSPTAEAQRAEDSRGGG